MIKPDAPCPCCSGKPYFSCCQKYHLGQLAVNAEALMRSRYSAYALHLSDYIIQTTHPQNPSYQEDFSSWRKEIDRFSESTTFRKLEVHHFLERDDFATVSFTAYLMQDGHDVTFTEKSRFQKLEGKWLYLDGVVSPIH